MNNIDNIICENKALGSKSGKALFEVDKQKSRGMGKLSDKNQTSPIMNGENYIEVDVETVDNYVESHSISPNFILIDVEGAEDLVLQGATNLIEKQFPDFIIEFHGENKKEFVNVFFSRYDYKIRDLDTNHVWCSKNNK